MPPVVHTPDGQVRGKTVAEALHAAVDARDAEALRAILTSPEVCALSVCPLGELCGLTTPKICNI
jgi:hypothetical protein